MKERWILFYDGACPVCMRSSAKLPGLLPNVKLTAIDLNSPIAQYKGYGKNSAVLETPNKIFKGYRAWLKILSCTKYKWTTFLIYRPFFLLFYALVSKNRQLISKII